MKLLVPAPEHIVAAQNLYPFGSLKDSIMSGESNVYGAVGEVMFSSHYPNWMKVESRNHDFVSDKGRTVDVKTKRTTAVPRGNWNCSVAATSAHQHPDYYYFIRVSEDLQKVWLLGWLSREEFYAKAVFWEEGQRDPERPDWRFRADCWNIRVDQLRQPR